MSAWWTIQGDCHQELTKLVDQIYMNQEYQRRQNLMHARLYGNLEILGLTTATYSRPVLSLNQGRVTWNVIESCIDTAAAKIAKSRPRPTFLTSGGDWGLQQQAKKLEKVVAGQFYGSETYEETAKAFVDAAVLGSGIVKVFSKDEEVINERVLVEEFLVDDAESLYGKPRNLYQRKPVAREALMLQFPEHEIAISALKSIQSEDGYTLGQPLCDMVWVIEAWHLKSSKDAKDGRHAIAIVGATLVNEQWDRARFPIAKLPYKPRQVGWYDKGIAEILVGIQVQINKMLQDITRSDYLNSAPAWLVENGSKIVSAHINNDIGHVIKYTGIPPELRTWATHNPQKAEQLEALYNKAYELTGVSQLSANSQKPAGLDSGKALREYNDIESERFIQVGQRWEKFHMDIAKLNIEESKAIYATKKNLSFKARTKKFVEDVKWSEVDLNEEKYVMQIFPTSSLPNTPAGRLAYVQELMTAGLIDPDTGIELLDFPDLEQNNNLRFAARNVARETVQMIMDDNKFRPPEPFDDLEFLKTYAQMSYNYARIHGAPEETLELLRRLIEQCVQLQAAAQPNAPAPQGAVMPPTPPDAGVGAPPPLPTAELMQAV